MKLTLLHDPYCESPNRFDGWKLCHFNRDTATVAAAVIDKDAAVEKYGAAIDAGEAFLARYSDHGPVCLWELSGDGYAEGIVVWESPGEPLSECYGGTVEGRRAAVASFLVEYTQWCNGECYGFMLQDSEGEHLDSCWGFIGTDVLFDAARDSLAAVRAEFSDDPSPFDVCGESYLVEGFGP